MLEEISPSNFLSEIFFRKVGRCRRLKKSEGSELSAAGLAPATEGGVSASVFEKNTSKYRERFSF